MTHDWHYPKHVRQIRTTNILGTLEKLVELDSASAGHETTQTARK